MKFIFNITIVLILTLILDLILTFFLFSNFNFYSKFYPKLDHRISNKYYHHSFKENVNTFDYWGNTNKYEFVTNSLGFKDQLNRKINNKNNYEKRIIFLGDSFTEGIGYKYEDTFVGLLDNQLSMKNIEILNAGVASQSPKIYFNKIKYLVENKNIKFDELVLFLDISDIPDEYYYDKNFSNNSEKRFNFRDYLNELLLKNLSIYLFFDVIISKLKFYKEELIFKMHASKEFNIKFSNIKKEHIDLYKAVHVERGNWTHDNQKWKFYGKKGRKLAELNLNKLLKLCQKNKIKFSLVIYPWPAQIFYNYDHSLHNEFWYDWSKKNNISLIDLFKYFDKDDPVKIINKMFIEGDIHWNKIGHRFIYDIMMKEYFYNYN